MALYLLYEHASGYGLFELVQSEEIGVTLPEVQKSITDLKRFSKIMKMKAFLPFTSAENALENINAISEGELTPTLQHFIEMNLPDAKKSKKIQLGVVDPKIGNAISELMGIKCLSNEMVLELIRGIRLHFERFNKALRPGDIAQAQLGLGHSYSRAKVKFNVHKVDNMIIQAIALLDQTDKDLNTFSMRVRDKTTFNTHSEWYGYHFPELVKIVNDNHLYARCAKLIKAKEQITEEIVAQLEEILGDPDKAKQVYEAAKISMGYEISPVDMINVEQFADRVIGLFEFRKKLHTYLLDKMNSCAPNLSALIGEAVGARLISHAGSLTNLAKYPASTVQILGAEKALFRALKTKGNTPKYGLIFHSAAIGRAAPKNKGRISRYLANKCSLASRIDCFGEFPAGDDKFGVNMRAQVEERLEFYKTGATPRKNIDVMHLAMAEAGAEAGAGEKKKKKKKDKEKKEKAAAEEEEKKEAEPEAADEEQAKDKKQKKKKRKAEAEASVDEEAADVEMTPAPEEKKKKKKKQKKEEPEAAEE